MPTPPFPGELEPAHRWLAIELNNGTWSTLERTDRTPADNERMVHAAHAACHHWLQVGSAVNHQRALVLLAFVYADVGPVAAALVHARRCLELAESEPEAMADFDWAFAYDALASAYAAAGATEDARHWHDRAAAAADQIKDPQDREVFDQWFARRSSG